MRTSRKDAIRALLKSIETGEPGPIAVVDQSRYIQHNPQTHEGSEGLESLFARLSKTNPRVNVVRAFEDGDFVFGHTEYDFASRKIGFEVFRFDGDKAVEHWDNIQERQGPNASGRSMVDGPTEATDLGRTEENRAIARDFVRSVLIGRDLDRLTDFIDAERFAEHNPRLSDDVSDLRAALEETRDGAPVIAYRTLHRVLAEGDFVLTVCEGERAGLHAAFYDLFRLTDAMIVEHWDTVEKVAPRETWKNDNGKF